MSKRPPSLAERLRSVWAQQSLRHADASTDVAAPARAGDPATEFADRLRAAVTARR